MVLQVQAGTRTAAALGLPKHQHRLGGAPRRRSASYQNCIVLT
jgi:hypothetical protein